VNLPDSSVADGRFVDAPLPLDSDALVDSSRSTSDSPSRRDAATDTALGRDAAADSASGRDAAATPDASSPPSGAFVAGGWTAAEIFAGTFGGVLDVNGDIAAGPAGLAFVYQEVGSDKVHVAEANGAGWSSVLLSSALTYGGGRAVDVTPVGTAIATFFDEHYYSGGSLQHFGLWYSERQSNGSWLSEMVIDDTGLRFSPVEGLCLLPDGSAIVQNSYHTMRRAVRAAPGTWALSPLTPATDLGSRGVLGCSVVGNESLVLTSQRTGDSARRAAAACNRAIARSLPAPSLSLRRPCGSSGGRRPP
jgi:hypothetical protein